MAPTPNNASIYAIVIEAPAEFVKALCEKAAADIKEIEISEPVSTNSPADILDSPMSGEDIRQVLQLVTLVITTTQAGMKLIDTINELLHKLRPQRVLVRDGLTGEQRGQVSEASSRDDVERLIQG